MRWLINTFPTWALVALFVGGMALFAASGLVVVHRRFPHLASGEHNDVAGVLLGVVGAIYGILLAFVIVAVYQSYTDTEASVRTEASTLAEVVRDTRLMSVAPQVDAATRAYVHDVVTLDWPAMANGNLSPVSGADLDRLFADLQSYEPTTNAQVYFYEAAIGNLDQVVQERRTRQFESERELPPILDVLIVGGAVLVVAFMWLFGMHHLRTQVVMVVGVAALVGFSVLVAVDLDHPFAGHIAVSSAPFREGVLEQFWP